MHLIPFKPTRAMRPIWLLAAAVAVAAGVVAGAGNATPSGQDGRPSYPHKATFKEPKLADGVLTVKGTNAGERIVLRLQPGDPGTLQVDVGDDGTRDFSFARAGIAKIVVNAKSGDDFVRVDESNGTFTDTIPTTIEGAEGDDAIAGGKGNETLIGGPGDDLIDGNGGNDVASLGSGDDTFVWDPGDGSDTLEGQAGDDTMVFNGANAAEPVELSANESRFKFFRNPGNITMDTAGIERVDFNALGGADVVTVDDLAATDVTAVNIDLAGTLGGAMGDGVADRVVVNATDGNDAIKVNGNVKVSGLAATTRILRSEAANDRLEINTLAGRDNVDSRGLAAGLIQLFVDGVLVP